MGDELKRQLIERMRTVKWMLRVSPKLMVSPPDMDPLDLAEYGQRLERVYRTGNTTLAKHLLAAVL